MLMTSWMLFFFRSFHSLLSRTETVLFSSLQLESQREIGTHEPISFHFISSQMHLCTGLCQFLVSGSFFFFFILSSPSNLPYFIPLRQTWDSIFLFHFCFFFFAQTCVICRCFAIDVKMWWCLCLNDSFFSISIHCFDSKPWSTIQWERLNFFYPSPWVFVYQILVLSN